MDRPGGPARCGCRAAVRGGLLSVPRQRAGERRAKPAVHGRLRVRQRSSVGRAARARSVAAPAAGIYRNRPAAGIARVVCYSPRHDLTLAELELPEVDRLLEVWQEQYPGSGRTRRHRSRARLREQGRSRRRLEPPPALPDLRDEFRIQDDRDGSAALASGTWPSTGRVLVPGHSCRRAGRRPPHHRGERLGHRLRAVFRALRLRGLRGAEGDAPEPRGTVRGRAARSRRRVTGGSRPLRQPVADAVSLRHAAAPGPDRRSRVSGLPLPYRVPPAAPQTQSAEIPGRAGDRGWQLPERHGAGREGRRVAGSARRPLQEGAGLGDGSGLGSPGQRR